ncbi:MAG: transporter [Thermodesulfobacteriota bacterium]|nr:transporter [Thermodesulfobacteriota bacterium]
MRQIIAAMAIIFIMMPQISSSEEKLFMTDVLEKRDMELGVNFSYSHFSDELSSSSDALNADRRIDRVGSGYAFNVGLGHGIEVGAWTSYLFSERLKVQYPSVPKTTTRASAEGFGDIALTGKYLILDEKERPFTLVAGLDVKFDSAPEDKDGTGTTDIYPSVAASTTLSEGLRPFARYTFVARNHGARDSHEFLLGAEKELNENVGLQAGLEARFHTSSDVLRHYESYHLQVQSYIRICQDFYAVPKVVYAIRSTADIKATDSRFDSATSAGLTLGFYYLF